MKNTAVFVCLGMGIALILFAGITFQQSDVPGKRAGTDDVNSVLAAGTIYNCVPVSSTAMCAANGVVSSCNANTVGYTCGQRYGANLNEKCVQKTVEYDASESCNTDNDICTHYNVCTETEGWIWNTYSCDLSGAYPANTRIKCSVVQH